MFRQVSLSFMRFVLLMPLFLLFAEASSCHYKDDNINNLCQQLEKKSIAPKYINQFLSSDVFLSDDTSTLRTINKSKIKYHRAQEKKANRALVKYIPKIIESLEEYAEVYALAEKRYGVNKEIIAAILMKETRLGAYKPKHNAITSLGTVYRHVKPDTKRNRWLYNLAKNNLIDLIDYCYRHNLNFKQCDFKSSYIGAIGYAQFMPSSFKYIVPYQNDFSLLDNIPDSILSVANYLHQRAKYRQPFNFDSVDDFVAIEEAWYQFATQYDNASFGYGGKYQCFACNQPKLSKLSAYIKKIMRYNNSSNYAIGVFRLAYSANQQMQARETQRLHIVKKGETLFSIGLQYNIRYTTIKKHNNLQRESLRIGQKLLIPNL